MIYFLIALGVIAGVYLIGFLYFFFVVLFENDHKFGNGPNWIKAVFGVLIGIVWPWFTWELWKEKRQKKIKKEVDEFIKVNK